MRVSNEALQQCKNILVLLNAPSSKMALTISDRLVILEMVAILDSFINYRKSGSYPKTIQSKARQNKRKVK